MKYNYDSTMSQLVQQQPYSALHLLFCFVVGSQFFLLLGHRGNEKARGGGGEGFGLGSAGAGRDGLEGKRARRGGKGRLLCWACRFLETWVVGLLVRGDRER